MLRQRVVTAIALLLVLLPAMFYPSAVPLSALAIVFIAAAAWEWARLVGYGGAVSWMCAAVCALACALAWAGGILQQPVVWLWSLMAGVWLLGAAWLLHGGTGLWSRLPRALRMGIGFLVLFAAWVALAQARHGGVNFVLSIMALVWVADISAYFAGRTWGGRIVARKLAPSISRARPGKVLPGRWSACWCWPWHGSGPTDIFSRRRRVCTRACSPANTGSCGRRWSHWWA